MDRLRRQLDFILEADRVKQVLRRSRITGELRHENDAEHMWHVALAALVLAEHVDEEVDVNRVIKMLLVHDLVEIDAGDVFVYDDEGRARKEEAERAAADRIFAILPDDQRDEFRTLWEEYEAKGTAEARFAGACDRILPVLLNHTTKGSIWTEHQITSDRVLGVNETIGRGSAVLWSFVQGLIADAVEQGFLSPPPGGEPARSDPT